MPDAPGTTPATGDSPRHVTIIDGTAGLPCSKGPMASSIMAAGLAPQRAQVATTRTVPLIVLIGGATGVGTSTVATTVASRLGIVRVASTDVIRARRDGPARRGRGDPCPAGRRLRRRGDAPQPRRRASQPVGPSR